ncbi:MAG: hypothetical protein L3J71_13660 [Victivallaceae bacterium]|nr:hypothetical protein [Victivallaceae bacterium]
MKKINKLTLVIIMLMASSTFTFGKNLITENPSFEVGRWGFDPMPYVFIRNWQKYIYPVVTDKTAAHGKYSLKLSNPTGMDALDICFTPFKITQKTPVIVSFYAKGKTNRSRLNVAIKCGWNRIGSKTFNLSTEWKRYSLPMVLGNDFVKEARGSGRQNYYALVMTMNGNRQHQPMTVWVDAIQIEKGDRATEFQPGKKLTAAVDFSDYKQRRLLIYTVGDKPKAILNIYSTSGRQPYNADCTVTDVISNKVVWRKKLQGRLTEDGHDAVTINLPAMQRRVYLLKVIVKSGDETTTALRSYGAIQDLSNKRQGNPYFGGSIETMEPHRSFMYGVTPDYRLSCNKRSPQIYIDLAKKMGWQWVHLYHQVSMNVVAPQRGKLYWQDSDTLVKMLRNADLEIMALLSSHGSIKQVPRWAYSDKKSLGGTSRGKGATLIDNKIYEEYCYQAAKHYKQQIPWWESWNEPSVKMRPQEYLPILKACYNGIKRGNPQAKVLGLCGTWDIGGDLYGWVKRMMKLGADKYMDAISIHGYHVKERDYGRQVANIARRISGKKIDVWDTESGNWVRPLYGIQEFFKPSGNKKQLEGEQAADEIFKHIVNELASGMKRQSYFNLDTTYDRMGKPELTLVHFDGSPDAGLIADNTVAEFLMDSALANEPVVAGNSVVYIFKRNGRTPLAVYWNNDLTTTATLQLDRSKVKLYDVLGGTLALQGNDSKTALPLDRHVRLLEGVGISTAQLKTAFENMVVKGLAPITVKQVILDTDGKQPRLRVTFKNLLNLPSSFKLTVKRSGGLTVTVPEKLTIAPYASQTISCPITIKSNGKTGGTILLVAELPEQTLAFKLRVPIITAHFTNSAVKVDGRADEPVWQQAATPQSQGDWVNFKTAWNRDGLYFFCKVKDADIVNYHDRAKIPVWNSDGIELFFDLDRHGDLSQPVFNGDDLQLSFAKGSRSHPANEVNVGPKNFAGNKKFNLSEVKFAAHDTDDGYYMEIMIPWQALNALVKRPEAVLGFSFGVRDINKNFKPNQRLIWSGSNKNYRDTSGFGLLILKSASDK